MARDITSRSQEKVELTLETISALSLLADDVKNRVDELSTLGVVTLCPVVASTRLAKDEVIRTEELAKWTGTDSVHGAGLQVDENGTGNPFVTGCL